MKTIITLLVIPVIGFAQGTYIPLGNELYHSIDRLEIKSGKLYDSFHSTIKPIRKDIIKNLYESNIETFKPLSKQDDFNLSKTTDKKSNKPVLKSFYKYQKDFYSVFINEFELHVNPVLNFQYVRELDVDEHKYTNTRGIETSGVISRKVGFYAFVTDNQHKFPSYISDRIINEEAVPGEGYYKEFKEGKGFDYFTARGYFNFNIIKNISLQFGHDKNFWGNGYRSLVLSDYSHSYLFLKLNTNVWRLNYQNLFTELTSDYSRTGDRLLDKKYGVFHHISVNVTKHINIGLFETVIFGRNDTTQPQQFELNYLNPVIFYRSVEQQLGSPDNASMGGDVKINMFKHISLYGQFLLDDFYVQEFKKKSGWYGNKYGWQTGIKYIDFFGVNNLDIQFEINTMRPYVYSHINTDRNYTHYNQPLAHPLGANFKEYLGIIRYQPFAKLTIDTKIISAKKGDDTDSTNWGGNIFNTDYKSIQLYNNKVLQGITTSLNIMELFISYQWKPGIYFDLLYQFRKYDSQINLMDTETQFIIIGFRMNITRKHFYF